jgi:hypothetical protein
MFGLMWLLIDKELLNLLLDPETPFIVTTGTPSIFIFPSQQPCTMKQQYFLTIVAVR